MSRLNAMSLLDFASEKGLNNIYRQILAITSGGEMSAERAESEELRVFLRQVPRPILKDTLLLFLQMARGRMDTHKAEAISAVPLSKEQLHKVEIKLIGLLHRQLEITATVDPGLLGGLRIVVDDMVIDYSVKHRLFDMKQAVYRRVFLNDESEHA